MNTAKLVVRAIVGAEKNGMSRVIVSRDVLGDIIQSNQAQYSKARTGVEETPKLSFVDKLGDDGLQIRVFSIDGTELYSFYDRAKTGKSYFFMKTADAQKCLLTLAQELPKVAFSASAFDLDVVASA